jgi:hypothetical protein
MPSSISSSEPAGVPSGPGNLRASVSSAPPRQDRYTRAIILSLVCFGLLVVLLEVGIRVAFNQVSRIGKRIAGEYSLARSIAPGKLSPGKPGKPQTVLIVGNSLLLEGVDFPDLQQRVAHGLPYGSAPRVLRFVIERTAWLDWYYGIRRLLAEGSRPDVIILCLDARQLMNSSIRGDYSSFYLFQVRDIPAVTREAHYNLTQASSLLFAHYSRFYADRTNLRSFVLNRLDPAYVEMMYEMAVPPAPLPSAVETERMAETRLAALKAAGASQGVRCILLIPPGSIAGGKEISAAAARVGAEVWVPIPQDALPRSDYQQDGYHLNQHGAALFTQALASEIKNLAVAAK